MTRLIKIQLVLLTKLGKGKPITLSQLDLESKGQSHSKNQKPMPWGTKNMPPKKNLSRGSLSNWYDADADADANANADADMSKTICRPPPYRGVNIKILGIHKVLNTTLGNNSGKPSLMKKTSKHF